MNFPLHLTLTNLLPLLHFSHLAPLKPLKTLHSFNILVFIEIFLSDFQSLTTFFIGYKLIFESFLASLAALRMQLQVSSERFLAARINSAMFRLTFQFFYPHLCNVIGTTTFFPYPIDR